MKLRLLPSTFAANGTPSLEQRLSCYVIDDCVAIDAGSLALGVNEFERANIRNIVITHTHIDHIATLPIFIDDVFDLLTESICVHATKEIIRHLEQDIFNWHTYPRFTEINNGCCQVMRYVPFEIGKEFQVAHLTLQAAAVDHTVPTVGLLIKSGAACIGYSADTCATESFWQMLNQSPHLNALFIETSFPNSLSELAAQSGHLTPQALTRELAKLTHRNADIYAVHLKPAHRANIIGELAALKNPRLHVIEPNRIYEW